MILHQAADLRDWWFGFMGWVQWELGLIWSGKWKRLGMVISMNSWLWVFELLTEVEIFSSFLFFYDLLIKLKIKKPYGIKNITKGINNTHSTCHISKKKCYMSVPHKLKCTLIWNQGLNPKNFHITGLESKVFLHRG